MPTRGLHSLLPWSPQPANSSESNSQDPFRQLQHLCASVLNRLPGRAHQQQSEQAPEHGRQLQSSAGSVPAVHGHADRLQGISFSANAQPSYQSAPHDLRSGLHKVSEVLHMCLMYCARPALKVNAPSGRSNQQGGAGACHLDAAAHIGCTIP